MNIFNIPSWYPSDNNPIYGTFVKEQIHMVGSERPGWNLAISTWGQGDPDHMLWVRDHLTNLGKIVKNRSFHSEQSGNLFHYHTPTLTWTRRFMKGNLQGLVRTCGFHLERFREMTGNVDIIHAQATYPAALIAQQLSERYDVPYFVTIRMSPFPFAEFLNHNGTLKSWVENPLENAKALIATSTSLRKRLQSFGFENTEVLHNPVDTEFFKPTDTPCRELTFLTVGRMVEQKGIDILVGSLRHLGDRTNVHFRIAGDGEMLSEYQQLAKDQGVHHSITWLGELNRAQVRDEMQQCSCYLLPSRHETFGNVVLEAMSCGKPVIATRCGGPEDIVEEHTGLLCAPDDEKALAESIQKILDQPERFDKNSIRQSAVKRFSPSIFTDELEQIFTQ